MSTAIADFEIDSAGHRLASRPSAGDLQRGAKPPTAEESAAAEQRREERYRTKQRELAAARFAEQTWHKLGEALEAVAQRKEELASAHVATAAPLQARLKSLEDQIITSIKNREAVAPKLEAERTELLTKIQGLNADLKTAIAREDSIVAQLEGERTTAAKAATVGQREQELLALAPAAERTALQVARSSLRWAQARLSAAREAKRSEAFSAELQFAQAEVLRLQAAEREAFTRCLEA